MIQNILSNAIASSGSTIIFGNLGRYPTLLNHLLKPLLIPQGSPEDDPGWFQTHDGRHFYLWLEPSFGTEIPGPYQNLVLTSHLDLKWDRFNTKVVYFHIGKDTESYDSLDLNPQIVHPYVQLTPATTQPFYVPFDPSIRHFFVQLDGSDVHSNYLSLLTFWDTWRLTQFKTPRSWSFSLLSKDKLKWHLKRSSDNIEKFIGKLNKEMEYCYFHGKMANTLLD